MKIRINVIMLVLISLLLVGCNKKTKAETYETFRDKHLGPQTTFTQPEEEYYVYFYKDECPACVKVQDLVFAQAKNKEMPLYFVNQVDVIDFLVRTDNRDYNNYGAQQFSEIKIFGFPTIVLIKNGMVIAQFVGSTAITNELGK